MFLALFSPLAVVKGLFISAPAANGTRAAPLYAAAMAKIAEPPWNLTTSPWHINSLVLQQVSSGDDPTALYSEAIRTVIAGAAHAHVPLFVGTAIFDAPDSYCGQVLNETYIQHSVNVSVRAAKAFIARFGTSVLSGWYITRENFLNYLAEGCHSTTLGRHVNASTVAAGWASLLHRWTEALNQVVAGLPFLWSPSAPESPRSGADLESEYATTLIRSLRAIKAAAPLLTNLTVQDSVGKASNVSLVNRTVRYGVGCEDAAFHVNLTRLALPDVHVSVNMEIFLRAGQRVPSSDIVDLPGDPREVEMREACYANHGVPIGPSWEANYWYRQLSEEWRIPDPRAA
jgi:hypothetical protein